MKTGRIAEEEEEEEEEDEEEEESGGEKGEKIEYRNSIRTAQGILCATIRRKTIWILYAAIVTAYYKNHVEHINTMRG